MLRRSNIVLVISVLVVTWAMLGTAVAQEAAGPKPQDKLALGEDEIKQLLLLMDANKDGEISKQEWTKGQSTAVLLLPEHRDGSGRHYDVIREDEVALAVKVRGGSFTRADEQRASP